MPLVFVPDIVEGKVYRSRKRNDDDEEKQALKELQTVLNNKNRRSCDCEAQIHDLLENCLNCGRLTCQNEGPGKCFSCGNIVLSKDQRNRLNKHVDVLHSFPAAQNRLAHSSNNQPKTKIIDNQFDQFAIDNKKHLRKEERRNLRENLEELQSQRYQRKLMLSVDVDCLQAGADLVPQIEDYNAQLQKLQLDCAPNETCSNLTLAELVSRESKQNYNFEYTSKDSLRSKASKQSGSEGATVKIGDSIQKNKPNPQQKPKGQRKRPLRSQYNNNSSKKDNNRGPPKAASAWRSESNIKKD